MARNVERRIGDKEARILKDLRNEFIFDRRGNRWLVSDEKLDERSDDVCWCGERLNNDLPGLTEKQRFVVKCRIEGQGLRVIGEQMGITAQGVHRILRQAQTKLLKQYFKEQ